MQQRHWSRCSGSVNWSHSLVTALIYTSSELRVQRIRAPSIFCSLSDNAKKVKKKKIQTKIKAPPTDAH